jgi:hypothetical protein
VVVVLRKEKDLHHGKGYCEFDDILLSIKVNTGCVDSPLRF